MHIRLYVSSGTVELGSSWYWIDGLEGSMRMDGLCALALFVRHWASVQLWNPVLVGIRVGPVILWIIP